MDWLRKNPRGKPTDTTEKRKTYRMGCSVPVVVQLDNMALEGRVLNLSTTGMKLQLGQLPKVGTTYTAWIRGKTLPGGLPPRELGVQAKCVWSQRNNRTATCEGGLLFTDFFGNQLSQVLQFFDKELSVALDDGLQKRSHVRAARRLKITYATTDGRVSNAVIRNLCEQGVAILSRYRMEPGAELTFSLGMDTDKLRVGGHVVWCRKVEGEDLNEVGARFDTVPDADREKLGIYVTAILAEVGSQG
ncbi:MAG TPA: PilZ domain-containing protein [Candidatus Xenobia bacterium]